MRPQLGYRSAAHRQSIDLAKQQGDSVAYGLNAEIFSPRVVRGDEML